MQNSTFLKQDRPSAYRALSNGSIYLSKFTNYALAHVLSLLLINCYIVPDQLSL